MKSALHPNADAAEPDMSAFVYTSLRLPKCILDVQRVVLGQSRKCSAGGVIRTSSPGKLSAVPPGGDGCSTMVARPLLCTLRASPTLTISCPCVTAFQIEWNKMHTLIGIQGGLAERLRSCVTGGTWDDATCEESSGSSSLRPMTGSVSRPSGATISLTC